MINQDDHNSGLIQKINWQNESLNEITESILKDLVLQVLEKAKWNQSKTAKLLKISRQKLISRMRKFNISI